MNSMIRNSLILALLLLSSSAFSQKERSDIRAGNRSFKSEKFEESEVSYRKALDVEGNSIAGNFNLGDALYRQEKFEEAGKHFTQVSQTNTSKEVQGQALHNLGNTLLQEGKLDESIEAYKNALRKNPSDLETKYNLAYAQKLKKQQEEQEQQNKDQDQNKDQNKDQQDQQDQENKQDQNNDQQDQNQDQQDQDQQNKDQQNQDQQEKDQQKDQQQQQPQNKISKQDAERMLQALADAEKETQEKVKVAKAKAKRVRTLKEW